MQMFAISRSHAGNLSNSGWGEGWAGLGSWGLSGLWREGSLVGVEGCLSGFQGPKNSRVRV